MNSNIKDNIIVRPYDESIDKNFILATWMNSYYEYASRNCYLKKEIFFDEHEKIILELLNKDNVAVLSFSNDHTFIIGYVVYQDKIKKIIHYIFIKAPFRNLSYSKILLNSIGLNKDFLFTHSTKKFSKILKGNTHTYNPYLFYNNQGGKI